MDSSDSGKLFVGGLTWETTEEHLRDHFQQFGEVAEVIIMKDRSTGRSRGFGFVVFAEPTTADAALLEKHMINNRMVEAKKAVPRDEQQGVTRASGGGQSPGGGYGHGNPVGHSQVQGVTRTKKIFVGGLASTITSDDFRRYFEQFGSVSDSVVMYDHDTHRPRGFGFVTFDSEESAEKVLQKPFHELNDKMVEVKAAVPREASPAARPGNGGERGRYVPGYNNQGYPGYARPDATNYMAASRAGYPYGGYAYGMNGSYPGGYPATGGGAAPGYAGTPGYNAAGYTGYSNNNAGYTSPGRTAWSAGGGAANTYGGAPAASTGYAPGTAGNTYAGGMWGYGQQGGYNGNYYGTDNGGGYPSGYGATRENVYGSGNYGPGVSEAAAGAAAGAASYAVGYNGGYGGAEAYPQGYQERFRAEDGTADIPTSEGGYAGGYGASKQPQRGGDARFRPYPDRA